MSRPKVLSTDALPLVSVVIPIYNKRRHVCRSVESVLQQTVGGFELILVDDGSTDGSLGALEHLRDPRIRRIRQSNGGVSKARNTGIDLARASLVAFLDADDAWHPDFLKHMLALHRKYPMAGIYCSGYVIQIGETKKMKARVRGLPLLRQRFLTRNYFGISANGELPITASSVMIPKANLVKVGGFPLGENMGEDQQVWWQICTRQPFACDRRVLATYHRDADNRLCVRDQPRVMLPFARRLEQALPSLGLSWRQRWQAKRYIGGHLLHLARENLRSRHFAATRALLRDRRSRLFPVKWIVRRLQLMWLEKSAA
ncbi:MAG: glycosyltransferase family 2 protein [Pseudomonadota bacterium]